MIDLLHSHKTSSVREIRLIRHGIALSLVRGGCLDSLNRMSQSTALLKQEIDDEFQRREIKPESIAGTSSAVGEKRMTRCQPMGEVLQRATGSVIRSFRCLGISLPIRGNSDINYRSKASIRSVYRWHFRSERRTKAAATRVGGLLDKFESVEGEAVTKHLVGQFSGRGPGPLLDKFSRSAGS